MMDVMIMYEYNLINMARFKSDCCVTWYNIKKWCKYFLSYFRPDREFLHIA